ncbi:MAG: redoxin domain-containing protein [Coraliomargarita sp.]
MKKTLTTLFTLLATSLIAIAAVDTGAAAPDFTLADTTGAQHRLSDFKGKYVVLEWTNHKCPVVKKHYKDGNMQATQKELTEGGVIWLQVVSSAEGKQGHITGAEGEAIRKEGGHHSTAMLLDTSGTVGRQYGAKTTPHMFVIDGAGTLIYQGAIDNARSKTMKESGLINYVKAAYSSAKSGQAVEVGATPPYGCGVKY